MPSSRTLEMSIVVNLEWEAKPNAYVYIMV